MRRLLCVLLFVFQVGWGIGNVWLDNDLVVEDLLTRAKETITDRVVDQLETTIQRFRNQRPDQHIYSLVLTGRSSEKESVVNLLLEGLKLSVERQIRIKNQDLRHNTFTIIQKHIQASSLPVVIIIDGIGKDSNRDVLYSLMPMWKKPKRGEKVVKTLFILLADQDLKSQNFFQDFIDKFLPINFAEVRNPIDHKKLVESFVAKRNHTVNPSPKEKLKQQFLGQPHIIREIEAFIKEKELNLKLNKLPDRYLFVGPPGVGKTHLGQLIASVLDRNLILVHMANFKNPEDIDNFVGAREGLKGDGYLVPRIKENPNSVVLLDEIEKAHPTIINEFLLPVFGSGTLQDKKTGIQVDCEKTIWIMTSNCFEDKVLDLWKRSEATFERHVSYGEVNEMRDKLDILAKEITENYLKDSAYVCPGTQRRNPFAPTAFLDRLIGKVMVFTPYTLSENAQMAEVILEGFHKSLADWRAQDPFQLIWSSEFPTFVIQSHRKASKSSLSVRGLQEHMDTLVKPALLQRATMIYRAPEIRYALLDTNDDRTGILLHFLNNDGEIVNLEDYGGDNHDPSLELPVSSVMKDQAGNRDSTSTSDISTIVGDVLNPGGHTSNGDSINPSGDKILAGGHVNANVGGSGGDAEGASSLAPCDNEVGAVCGENQNGINDPNINLNLDTENRINTTPEINPVESEVTPNIDENSETNLDQAENLKRIEQLELEVDKLKEALKQANDLRAEYELYLKLLALGLFFFFGLSLVFTYVFKVFVLALIKPLLVMLVVGLVLLYLLVPDLFWALMRLIWIVLKFIYYHPYAAFVIFLTLCLFAHYLSRKRGKHQFTDDEEVDVSFEATLKVNAEGVTIIPKRTSGPTKWKKRQRR